MRPDFCFPPIVWRITFGFADGAAIQVDLEDYHG